ncbi:SDR family oxidoreductase [Thermoplasma sp.]|uniref:SDR family NAD(P)-dependent oxidoreductase n=1 Tax=Thermoplasma sp. TaxID=1973142 RepID=UPI001282E25C|nr:SDR family oxidoreductase [Thermoplasma sp.]KAA8922157.1 MAG: SDR family oxidoreductase [Thermoplasma sp.]
MENKRNAVITGATSGLGFELMNALPDDGWNVAVCGRRKNLIDEIRKRQDRRILAEVCDIRVEQSIVLFLKKVERELGEIDLLVLNAATIGPLPLRRLEELKLEDLRWTFETNFFGNFNFMKHSLPLLREYSLIIHITSDAATVPYPGWGPYSSSKAAFDMLIKILNEELRDRHISAFSFDPGDMDTEMHRSALPEDRSPLKDPKVAASDLVQEIRRRSAVHE